MTTTILGTIIMLLVDNPDGSHEVFNKGWDFKDAAQCEEYATTGRMREPRSIWTCDVTEISIEENIKVEADAPTEEDLAIEEPS